MNKEEELRREVALKAFESGGMIYSSGDQKWYTPRDFVNSTVVVEKKSIDTRQYYGNVTIHPAKRAIQAQIEKIRTAEKELQVLMDSMLDAFELQPKKKK